jgi:hypothetical protein
MTSFASTLVVASSPRSLERECARPRRRLVHVLVAIPSITVQTSQHSNVDLMTGGRARQPLQLHIVEQTAHSLPRYGVVEMDSAGLRYDQAHIGILE